MEQQSQETKSPRHQEANMFSNIQTIPKSKDPTNQAINTSTNQEYTKAQSKDTTKPRLQEIDGPQHKQPTKPRKQSVMTQSKHKAKQFKSKISWGNQEARD